MNIGSVCFRAAGLKSQRLPEGWQFRGSIFGAFAVRGHFDEFGIELTEDFDEIGLGGHDLMDVFIDTGDFIEAG